MPQSGSPLIVQEDAKQGAKENAFVSQQGNALGALRAFGDVLGTASRGQARDASAIGQVNNFKTGSSNVLPLELDAAQSAGAGAQTFGDILGLGGSLLTAKGLSGKSTTPSTLSNVIGYTPTNSPSYYPAAPKKGLFNLFGN